MIEPPHRSPARVSAQAAAALPRWALLGLLAAFVLPGLFGRDLWPQDAEEFGRMWTMAHGSASDWWLPNVAGATTPQGGPLAAWAGALAIRLLGPWLGDPAAAAVSVLLWFALGAAALWQAAFRLARREEAQPVALVFGGEASRRDYARMLADIALLLYIGTLGIVPRLHEIQSDAVVAALVAAAMFSLTAAEWRRPLGATAAGVVIGALELTQGPLPAAGLLAGSVAALALTAPSRRHAFGSAALAAAVALAVAAAWPACTLLLYPHAGRGFFDAWLAWVGNTFGWPGGGDFAWLLRNAPWFTWPLWPLAGWAVYAWRAALRNAHIAQPLLVLGGLAAAMLVGAPFEEHQLVALVPPLVLLASFGATTLRRALDNLVDWFAMSVFSLFALLAWAYFLAMVSGVPRAMAASMARLAPGYAASVHGGALGVALVATTLWIALVAWRVGRRPRVLWRGPLLSAGGVAMLWLVAHALYLPAADHVFSSRPLAQDIATRIRQLQPDAACVQMHRVPLAERALFAYYGRLPIARDAAVAGCPIALHRDSGRGSVPDDPPPGGYESWSEAWQGRGRARSDEIWRIWVRRGR